MGDSTIVYTPDYTRPGEYEARKTSTERKSIERKNRKRRALPDRCWTCRYFPQCEETDPNGCSMPSVRSEFDEDF